MSALRNAGPFMALRKRPEVQGPPLVKSYGRPSLLTFPRRPMAMGGAPDTTTENESVLPWRYRG